jgi:plastocyanin
MMRTIPIGCAFAAALMASGCGDGSTSPTPNQGGSTGGATIVITSSGVSPQSVTVVSGAQVTFINSDSQPHEILSDPHSGHGDCPEINQVGVVQPGNNRQTGNLPTARSCGFHDERNPSNGSMRGSIRIQ